MQARLVRDSALGPAVQISSALPMILAGGDVYVARGSSAQAFKAGLHGFAPPPRPAPRCTGGR